MTKGRLAATTLGYVSPGVGLLALAAVAGGTFIVGAVAGSHSESLASMLYDAAFIAVGVALVMLTGSARIVANHDCLRVTNLFQVIEVDAGAVVDIEATQGLVIITKDGRRIRSFAYGASLVGALMGYRRAQAAQKRCRTWLATVASDEPLRRKQVIITLRPAVWLLPATLFATYVAEVLVVRAVT